MIKEEEATACVCVYACCIQNMSATNNMELAVQLTTSLGLLHRHFHALAARLPRFVPKDGAKTASVHPSPGFRADAEVPATRYYLLLAV